MISKLKLFIPLIDWDTDNMITIGITWFGAIAGHCSSNLAVHS